MRNAPANRPAATLDSKKKAYHSTSSSRPSFVSDFSRNHPDSSNNQPDFSKTQPAMAQSKREKKPRTARMPSRQK